MGNASFIQEFVILFRNKFKIDNYLHLQVVYALSWAWESTGNKSQGEAAQDQGKQQKTQ